MRPKILKSWLVYILNLVPYYLASALSIVSWVAALVPLLVTMGMRLAAIVLWSRCVTAIREDHLQRLETTAGQ